MSSVTTTLDGRVAVLEITRGPNNFFDEQLLTELAAELLQLDEHAAVRAVVLCSEGRHFCAGLDLRGVDAAGIRRIYRQAFTLFTGRWPVVAAIQGAAVGGGLGLAMAADFRVVGPKARLTANFARLGFHQGFGLSVTVAAAIGQQRANELLYTGRNVDAAEALELGLADRLTDRDPREAALSFAAEIAEAAPLALAAIRTTTRRDLVARVHAALSAEASAQAALLDTADFKEGVAAALERRAPSFSGT